MDATCPSSHRLLVTPRHCRQFTVSLAGKVAPDVPGSQGRSIFCYNILVFPIGEVIFEKLTGRQMKPEVLRTVLLEPTTGPTMNLLNSFCADVVRSMCENLRMIILKSKQG